MISHFILVLGFVVILLGALLIVTLVITRKRQNQLYHSQQKMIEDFQSQLLRSQIEVQESTYRHIAQELHDNVGQLLSTTKMLMGVTELQLGNSPDTLNTANTTLSKAIQEIRTLSRSLDKEWLEQFDFMENLQAEIERINASKIVNACVEGNADLNMKPEQQIILFRIVQEAVHNAVRHADPSFVKVQVQMNGTLEVAVINDGKPLPDQFSGMGTNNMRHRTKLFGGQIRWHRAEGLTTVNISLPTTA